MLDILRKLKDHFFSEPFDRFEHFINSHHFPNPFTESIDCIVEHFRQCIGSVDDSGLLD